MEEAVAKVYVALPEGSPEEIESNVAAKIEVPGAGGGGLRVFTGPHCAGRYLNGER